MAVERPVSRVEILESMQEVEGTLDAGASFGITVMQFIQQLGRAGLIASDISRLLPSSSTTSEREASIALSRRVAHLVLTGEDGEIKIVHVNGYKYMVFTMSGPVDIDFIIRAYKKHRWCTPNEDTIIHISDVIEADEAYPLAVPVGQKPRDNIVCFYHPETKNICYGTGDVSSGGYRFVAICKGPDDPDDHPNPFFHPCPQCRVIAPTRTSMSFKTDTITGLETLHHDTCEYVGSSTAIFKGICENCDQVVDRRFDCRGNLITLAHQGKSNRCKRGVDKYTFRNPFYQPRNESLDEDGYPIGFNEER